MSVIQKIRTKYARVAGFVIALSLVGFILMDASTGRFGDLFGQDDSVMKINGEKITYKEYSQRTKEFENLYAYSSGGKTNMDDAMRANVNAETIRDLIHEKLVKATCQKLGVMTTKDEEKDLIYGSNPDPIVQQFPYFADQQTKMFNPQYVKAFEQQALQMDPSGKTLEQWEALKAYILRNAWTKKYDALLTKSIYIPKFVTEYQQKEQTAAASIRFVKIPYASISDSAVAVKDADIDEYIKKHEAQYRVTEPTRSIEYVSFDVLPKAEDTARALGVLEQTKAEFNTVADAESFVNRNSDDPYKDVFVNKRTFMSPFADSILGLPVGSVYGPYFDNGSYKMTKVVAKTTLPDSVKCRHILVRTKDRGNEVRVDSVAQKKIDSAIAVAGTDFKAAVEKFTDDDGSRATSGEYSFSLDQRAGLSKEFADFIFEGKTGEKKTVKVDNSAYAGYHYIEILEQNGVQTAAKLATVSKALYAGENTENAAFAAANEFAGKYGNAKAFDEQTKAGSATSKRLADNIKMYDFNVPGMGASREVIRWVYEHEVNDVSAVFQMPGRYVVVKIAGKQDAGLMKPDANMRPGIEAAVRQQKKAEMIMSKYKGNASSLEAVAQASGQQVGQADSFTAANPFNPTMGYEIKVVGYAFYDGFKPNTISPAIKGQDGVFFTSLIGRYNKPLPPEQAQMAAQQKVMMESQLRNSASGTIMDMMRKNAKITYNVKNL
jgi:peptidyl-prolyl cis-trans isomerase D